MMASLFCLWIDLSNVIHPDWSPKIVLYWASGRLKHVTMLPGAYGRYPYSSFLS